MQRHLSRDCNTGSCLIANMQKCFPDGVAHGIHIVKLDKFLMQGVKFPLLLGFLLIVIVVDLPIICPLEMIQKLQGVQHGSPLGIVTVMDVSQNRKQHTFGGNIPKGILPVLAVAGVNDKMR